MPSLLPRTVFVISIHALREEGDDSAVHRIALPAEFLSTPSARRATLVESGSFAGFCYFYPRPPRGGRRPAPVQSIPPQGFLSTPSARRATGLGDKWFEDNQISIHALREEGDHNANCTCDNACQFLSTPSARRATDDVRNPLKLRQISIHALREEGDVSRSTSKVNRSVFLSTPSARRATAKTETKSLFSNKLYNILHEFRRALIYNGSKNYPNHAK